MSWNHFWLEIVIVRRSGDQTKFCLGGQEKDIAQPNGRVQGWGMYALGTWWAWWTTGLSEVSKSRLLAHVN